MTNASSYRHVQRAPLCLLIYGLAIVFMAVGVLLCNESPIPWLFLPIGLLMLALAASIHHLTVEERAEHLRISFGPVSLFRKKVPFDDIVSVETGRTTILDGWGIHMSVRGGWVWNLWGRDCVVLQLRKSILRVGTDDAMGLAEFLRHKISVPLAKQ